MRKLPNVICSGVRIASPDGDDVGRFLSWGSDQNSDTLYLSNLYLSLLYVYVIYYKETIMKSFATLILFAPSLFASTTLFFQGASGFTVSKAAKTKMPSTNNFIINADYLSSSSHQTGSRHPTLLSSTTKEPPLPPGNGKSVLDLIVIPLMVATAIPVALLMIHSVENTVSLASTASDTVGAGTVLMQTTLAQNP